MEQQDLLAMPSPVDIRGQIQLWEEAGWIRTLDLELALMLADTVQLNDDWPLLLVVFASHQLGRGHSCVDPQSIYNDPDRYLALPPDGARNSAVMTPSQLLAEISLDRWMALLSDSVLIDQGAGSAPLVYDAGLLYLRRMWLLECLVARSITERTSKDRATSDLISNDLATLFPTHAELDWQKIACAVAASSYFSVITGGPGTGKTTTVVRLLAVLNQQALRSGMTLNIALAAPTGKAAARLTESIEGALQSLPEGYAEGLSSEVQTLHRLLGVIPNSGRYRYHKNHKLPVDLLVVDEASMVDLSLFAATLDALPEHAQLVMLGDKDQLASVEAGAALADLCTDAEVGRYTQARVDWLARVTGCKIDQWLGSQGDSGNLQLNQHLVMLRESHRFSAESGIGQLASAVNDGLSDRVEQLLITEPDDLRRLNVDELQRTLKGLVLGDQHFAGYRAYLTLLEGVVADDQAAEVLAAFDRFRLLSALRRGPEGVVALNEQVESILNAEGLIERDSHQESEWYVGRPVMVTQNDYVVGLANGDIGITLMTESGLRVAFAKASNSQDKQSHQDEADRRGKVRWIHPSRLQSVETAYVMTVHKSQGSEFEHAAYLSPSRSNPVLTRELLYTAITRSKSRFTLVEMNRSVLMHTVSAKVERASGLYKRLAKALL